MLQINNIDYVEFYVGNASQAAHFYRMAFGFTPIAFSSLETGERDHLVRAATEQHHFDFHQCAHAW